MLSNNQDGEPSLANCLISNAINILKSDDVVSLVSFILSAQKLTIEWSKIYIHSLRQVLPDYLIVNDYLVARSQGQGVAAIPQVHAWGPRKTEPQHPSRSLLLPTRPTSARTRQSNPYPLLRLPDTDLERKPTLLSRPHQRQQLLGAAARQTGVLLWWLLLYKQASLYHNT